MAVIGTGYVGLVVGACLAETGNDVICADKDEDKILQLRKGKIPIYEPGLATLVERNHCDGRLAFTSDVGSSVEFAEVVCIAVGTPPDEDGSADLRHVLDVAHVIGEHMNSPKVVVIKSTVPVGTADKVREAIAELTNEEFYICSNPEFLKEGAAVDDFMKPDRIVVGVGSKKAESVLSDLYAPFVRTGNPLMFMDTASAELTKYAANAMLATRISFMNQMAELCEVFGADVDSVRNGLGADPRIGRYFLFPGPGYGGSCFPKDVRALIRAARADNIPMELLTATESVNQRQKKKLFQMVRRILGKRLAGARVAVWGLAFKAETDDVRESASLELVDALLEARVTVAAHDPAAIENARAKFGNRIEYFQDMYAAIEGAEALVVVTEWRQFRNPDFARIRAALRSPTIVDGRNLYDPGRMRELGFSYHSIGRRSLG